jgi:hypothetical protein
VRSKGGTDRRVVTANAPGLASAFAFGNAAVLGLQEPRIQILVTAFWEHQDKGLAELISSIQLTVCMAYLFDLVVLLFIELGRLAPTRPRGASGRYRLWDIDLIIQRTLVYGRLPACAISLYVLIVGYIGALVHKRSSYCLSGSYGCLRKESLPYPIFFRLGQIKLPC